MFGSDFPVAGLHASYGEVVGTLRALTADLSRDEQRAVFHDTARRVWGGVGGFGYAWVGRNAR